MSREAMQMALEALEDANDVARMEFSDEDYYSEAINALRQALETEQEPVAWANSFDLQNFDMKVRTCPDLHHTVPLYTAPPKQWLSLTDQEVWEAIDDVLEGGGWLDVARVLEQAFKEKNQ